MNNNVLVEIEAGKQVTSGDTNFCLGERSGFDITNQSNQIRIGNFTEGEVERNKFDDCLIFQEGRIVIKKDVVEYILQSQPQILEALLKLEVK